MSTEAAVAAVFAASFSGHQDRAAALDAAYQHLENAGVLNKLVVHRYRCNRGCSLAVVIRANGLTILRASDFKLAPGTNETESVAAARRDKTLDGKRHWPKMTVDVGELAEWGPQVGIAVNCRHTRTVLLGQQVLDVCEGIRPGHPGAPTLY